MAKLKSGLITVIIIAIMLGIGVAVCYFTGAIKPEIKLSLDVNGEVTEYKVSKDSENVHLDVGTVFVKKGYYIKGFYDQKEGGTFYMDVNGNLTQPWNKNCPKTLYAQWNSVDGYKINFSSNSSEASSFFANKLYGRYCGEEDASAIVGNLDRNLEITVSFKIMCPAYAGADNDPDKVRGRKFYIQDGKDKNAKVYHTEAFNVNGLEYNSKTFTFTCSARAFSDYGAGKRIIYVNFEGNSFYPTYIKDFAITVKFLPANK